PVAPAAGADEVPASAAGTPWRAEMLRTLVASAITFAALGLLILARYPLRHYAYPIGWDSPQYVWRAAAVTVDGLDRIGGIRAGSPLLVGVLMQVTGQNGFTMVAI